MNGLDLVRAVTPREPYAWTDGRGAWATAPPSARPSTTSWSSTAGSSEHPALPGRLGVPAHGRPGHVDRGRRSRRSGRTASSSRTARATRPPSSYAVETIRGLLGKKPLFGICLGHQLLALALGRQDLQAQVRPPRRQRRRPGRHRRSAPGADPERLAGAAQLPDPDHRGPGGRRDLGPRGAPGAGALPALTGSTSSPTAATSPASTSRSAHPRSA